MHVARGVWLSLDVLCSSPHNPNNRLTMASLIDHSPLSTSARLPAPAQNGSSTKAAPSISPIPSFQLCELVGNIETELLVQTFDDRIVVAITQNGKMGCMVRFGFPLHLGA